MEPRPLRLGHEGLQGLSTEDAHAQLKLLRTVDGSVATSDVYTQRRLLGSAFWFVATLDVHTQLRLLGMSAGL